MAQGRSALGAVGLVAGQVEEHLAAAHAEGLLLARFAIDCGVAVLGADLPGAHGQLLGAAALGIAIDVDGQAQLVVAAEAEIRDLDAGECFGEMAYLQKAGDQHRVADVTVMTEAKIISVPTAKLDAASETCRHKFDRAFMAMLVERLMMANIRLSGV